jgi:hypothetical protein
MKKSNHSRAARHFLALVIGTASFFYPRVSLADTICNVAFDAAKFGFEVLPLEPDEKDTCGRFLKMVPGGDQANLVVSLVVFSGHASIALKTAPSNFRVGKDGSVSFKRPRPFGDSRTLYFVRPLGKVSESKVVKHASTTYVAKHARTVNRLEKVNAREEREVVEVQHCVDAVRTSTVATIVVSGCALRRNNMDMVSQLLSMLESAQLPESGTAQSLK